MIFGGGGDKKRGIFLVKCFFFFIRPFPVQWDIKYIFQKYLFAIYRFKIFFESFIPMQEGHNPYFFQYGIIEFVLPMETEIAI